VDAGVDGAREAKDRLPVTIERRELVMRLKSVDFPTLGRPTSTTLGPLDARFCGIRKSI